jgi:hypothetical protein
LKSESPIERQILDYLASHPDAQDTSRGIVEWWLLKQRITEATADVEAALAKLVAEGKLTAKTGLDGRVRYSQNQKRSKKFQRNN